MSKLDKRFVFDSDRVDGKDYTDFFNDFVQQGDYPYSRVGENDIFSVNCGVNFPANIFEDKSVAKYLEYPDGKFILCMGIDYGEKYRSLVALKIDEETDTIQDSFTVIDTDLNRLYTVTKHSWFYSTNDATNGLKFWLRKTNNTAQYQSHIKIDVTNLVSTYGIHSFAYYPELDVYVGSSINWEAKTVTHYLFDSSLNLVDQATTYDHSVNMDDQGITSVIYHTSRPSLDYYIYDEVDNRLHIKNIVGYVFLTEPTRLYGSFVDYIIVSKTSISGVNSSQTVTYNTSVQGVYYTTTSNDYSYYNYTTTISPYKNGSIVIRKPVSLNTLVYYLSSLTYKEMFDRDFLIQNDQTFSGTFRYFSTSDNSLFSKVIYRGTHIQNFQNGERYVALYSYSKSVGELTRVFTDFFTATGSALNPVYNLTKDYSQVYAVYRGSNGDIISANYSYSYFSNDTFYTEVYYDYNVPNNFINETPDLTIKISNFSTNPIKTQIENDIDTLLTNLGIQYDAMEYSLQIFIYDNSMLVVHVQTLNRPTNEYRQFVIEYSVSYDTAGEVTGINYLSGYQTYQLVSSAFSYSSYTVGYYYSGSLIYYDVSTGDVKKIFAPVKYIGIGGGSYRYGVFVDNNTVGEVVFIDRGWLSKSVYMIDYGAIRTLEVTSPWYSEFLPFGSRVQLYSRSKGSSSALLTFSFSGTTDLYANDSSFIYSGIIARCISNTSPLLFLKEPYVIINGVKYDNIDLTFDCSTIPDLSWSNVEGHVYLKYDPERDPPIFLEGYNQYQPETSTMIKVATVDQSGAIYVSIAEPKKSIMADKPIQIYGDTSLIPVTNSNGKLTTDTITGEWSTSYRNVIRKAGDVFRKSDYESFILLPLTLENDSIFEFIMEWEEDIGLDNRLVIGELTVESQYGLAVNYGTSVTTRQTSSTLLGNLFIYDAGVFQPKYVRGRIWVNGNKVHIHGVWKRDDQYCVFEGTGYNPTLSTTDYFIQVYNATTGPVAVTYNLIARRSR